MILAQSCIRLRSSHAGQYADNTFVRHTDWRQAVNEYKKAHLLGEEAVAQYAKAKQEIADVLPAKIEVSSVVRMEDLVAHTNDSSIVLCRT